MQEAKQEHQRTKKPARVFCEFTYRTKKSWSRSRRVIAKAEQIEGKENPRYLVTSLGAQHWPAQKLYEQLYCARGEMENRIKEQLSLFADSAASTETLRAKPVAAVLSSLAYVLVEAWRRLGSAGPLGGRSGRCCAPSTGCFALFQRYDGAGVYALQTSAIVDKVA